MCLTTDAHLTADPEFDPSSFSSFVVIDHEITSTVILSSLPLIHLRMVDVSYK